MSGRRLTDRVAVVTGGGSGIGRGCSLRLAAEGAAVAVLDYNVSGAEATADQIRSAGGRAMALELDVTRVESIEPTLSQVSSQWGSLQILVSCAGVISVCPFDQLTVAEWDRVLNTNLRGTFFVMQAASRLMPADGTGRIITISSTSSVAGRPTMAHYAASKAAVDSITKSAAMALAGRRITVNAIRPGLVHTPMWDQIDEQRARMEGKPKGAVLQETAAAVPLGREASPADIAGLAAFLASDDASYMTGETILIDGGYMLRT